MAAYVLAIDQSTQGTKALLLDSEGRLVSRADLPHRQIVNDKGWVEHDPEEICANTRGVVQRLVDQSNIDAADIQAVGISNQRETAIAWDRRTGKPVYNAIVWQCARAEDICKRIEDDKDAIQERTGLRLSPYFSAAKFAWILENVPGARDLAEAGHLCLGTVDSWLIYNLTGGKFETDYSNAARTQLLNISSGQWDPDVCSIFRIPLQCLAQVCSSNADFGQTDFGFLPHPVPIHSALGDSNGALFGQGCLQKGMVKATYGTGTSVMMNIGSQPVFSEEISTSIAWAMNGTLDYVVEGNINYSGAVITWLKDDMGLIETSAQTAQIAKDANPHDRTYLVPAFSGLGAPWWDSDARAVACGMSRTTGRNEFVKAGLESIAYQISDVVETLEKCTGIEIEQLRVDGGATHNDYLMQFQSDILGKPVWISNTEELSGLGAGYMAGIASGLYNIDTLFRSDMHQRCMPAMESGKRHELLDGWKNAVKKSLH